MSRKRNHGRGSNKASFADIQREVMAEANSPAQRRLAQQPARQYDPVISTPQQAGYATNPNLPEPRPQYPPMEKVNDAVPPMRELGASGTAIFAGIITSEEYNPDLFWTEAIRKYDQMRRNDAQIFATLLLCELPIRGAEWKVEPASEDPFDLETASLTETALFHKVEGTWDDLLREVLTMQAYGFSLFEPVFKIEDDGTVCWEKIAARLQRTVWRWWIDPDNTWRGVQQWTFRDYTYEYLNIPAEKLLLFTNRREGNDFQGISLLRSVYKAWWMKEALLRIMGIGYEREHVGVPVFTLPPNHTADMEARVANIGKNLRAGEEMWVSLINGMTLEWMKSKGGERRGEGLLDALGYLDVQIARNVLGQFINLGSTETGSYALSSDQSAIFLMSLQATARYIESVFSLNAFPRLVRYNYRDPEMFPKLVCRKIQAFNFQAVGETLANLAKNGVVRPTADLEDFVLDALGAPKAPHNLVEATPGEGEIDQGQEQDSTSGANALTPKQTGPQQVASIPDVYKTDARLSMSRTQRRVYDRMAREVGRPRIVLSTTPRVDSEDTMHRDRAERFTRQLRRNYNVLRAELKKAVAERDHLAAEISARPAV